MAVFLRALPPSSSSFNVNGATRTEILLGYMVFYLQEEHFLGADGAAQWAERSSSMHRALGSVPTTALTRCGDSDLQPQHLGGADRKVRSSPLSSAT